jgi:2-octaprenyl-6-methoxyphenol hydroxylase
MDFDTDIAIIGAGLNGAVTALALARSGLRITILDAQAKDSQTASDFDGRAYAIALSSRRMLANLGVWNAVADTAQPMNDIKVTDGKAGQGPSQFLMHFDHREIEEGPMGHMVEDRHLRPVLQTMIDKAETITYRDAITVTAQEIDADKARLTLDTGETLTARLVIGADGRSSVTAKRAKIPRRGWGYEQTALVCAVAHEQDHQGVAHQFFMPAGPLAILPLKGNKSSIVWSEKADVAKAYMALDDQGFLEILRPRFGSFLGEISLAGKRHSYPLALSVVDRFIDTRLALVGDAAHGLHPIAGQGFNAGLRDIAALSHVISDAVKRGEDFASVNVLERYQEWRRFDVATLAAGTDLVNKLFSNDNALLRMGRDFGMGLINAVPSLRRGFIREAAGLTGELPRLMR